MIPIHKHYYRSQKIEYNLFPKNRKVPFTRKLFKKEYIRLLGVFMFWIYMVFAGVFFHVFLALYRETPYHGLKVNLPKAKQSKRLQEKENWNTRNNYLPMRQSAV